MESRGASIPKNSKDLLRMLQIQHKKNSSKTAGTDASKLNKKQAQKTEDIETRLMELEDYIFKPTEMDRIMRLNEQLKMEIEDGISAAVEAFLRKVQSEISLKEQIRKEVEMRKIQEAEERERRRKAAEERRAAVLERIRLQAELEEKRKQEAIAFAELQVANVERLKRQQLEREAAEQCRMEDEDDRSQLAEQDYREQIERSIWQKKEMERLREYERQQQQRDEEDKRKRLERMQELDEKKRRLQELQKKSQSSTLKITAADAQKGGSDEAAQLTRQLRIQNRAKFVTKRIQNSSGDKNLGSTLTHPVTKLSSSDEVSDTKDKLETLNRTVTEAAAVPVVDPTIQTEFLSSIEQLSTEMELKHLSIELMGEKRALKQEQRRVQEASHDTSAPTLTATTLAATAATAPTTTMLAEKIAMLAFKEEALQNRMNRLLESSDPTLLTAAAESKAEAPITVRVINNLNRSSQNLKATASHTPSTSGDGKDADGISSEEVFKQAELLLQEGHSLLAWLKAEETQLHEVLDWDGHGEASHGGLQRQQLRRIAVLPLEIAQVSKSLLKLFDPINYKDRLSHLQTQIKDSITNFKEKQQQHHLQQQELHSEEKSPYASSTTVHHLNAITENMKGTFSFRISTESMSVSPKKDLHVNSVLTQEQSMQGAVSVSSIVVDSSMFSPVEKVRDHSPAPSWSHSEEKLSSSEPVRHPKEELVTTIVEINDDMFLTKNKSDDLKNFPEVDHHSAHKIGANKSSDCVKVIDSRENWPRQLIITRREFEELSEGLPEEKEDDYTQEADDDGDVAVGDSVDWNSLPGWSECLNTSMASAAHHAAFYGHLEVLQMLSSCFDCFVIDEQGRTPLFYAALQNRLECVACLVELDPQWIDVGDSVGDTPLHAAASANGIEVLQFLLLCEGNPDTANHAGLTPCHVARSLKALEVLSVAGAQAYCIDSRSRMPLWFACEDGREDNVRFLCSITPPQYLLWPDDQGDTPLHRAAVNGHHKAVEILCQWIPKSDDVRTVNAKTYTAAHVAKTSDVLKALYESGANMWLVDTKGRMPLFMASFMGKVDCVGFLIELAISEGCEFNLSVADQQGDTALHAACLKGYMQCASLLLFHTSCTRNNAKLLPQQLADKAGHPELGKYVTSVHTQKKSGVSSEDIFGCDFAAFSAVVLFYRSRWTKGFDHSYESFYYVDRATGQTQWERPVSFDEPKEEEDKFHKACSLLRVFYLNFNPDKLKDINSILVQYRSKYTELFLSLAEKYNVEDLSIFEELGAFN